MENDYLYIFSISINISTITTTKPFVAKCGRLYLALV